MLVCQVFISHVSGSREECDSVLRSRKVVARGVKWCVEARGGSGCCSVMMYIYWTMLGLLQCDGLVRRREVRAGSEWWKVEVMGGSGCCSVMESWCVVCFRGCRVEMYESNLTMQRSDVLSWYSPRADSDLLYGIASVLLLVVQQRAGLLSTGACTSTNVLLLNISFPPTRVICVEVLGLVCHHLATCNHYKT